MLIQKLRQIFPPKTQKLKSSLSFPKSQKYFLVIRLSVGEIAQRVYQRFLEGLLSRPVLTLLRLLKFDGESEPFQQRVEYRQQQRTYGGAGN